jgi:heat shock protein HslJ
MISLMVELTSCGAMKGLTVSLDSLNGEWTITELNGIAVVPAAGQELPTLTFDTTTGSVSGNAGCNRVTGSFDTTAKKGTIDLSKMAATRMMCQDMTMEQNVLKAIAQVKGYRKAGEGMALTNGRRPVLVLTRK